LEHSNYELVIGLEVHIQLSTNTKAFCGDSTIFGSRPNSQVSPISLGHPGTLPFLNKSQVEFAIRLGLSLGSRINRMSRFDRKNYFYPDLPKGYQITQDGEPICVGGIFGGIRIHHIHMEEDAGKSIHRPGQKFSLIDLNRAGVPLLELVTEPDFRSAFEVEEFMHKMRQLVRYLGISDGNMEQGSLRCDCNVSVRKKGIEVLGQRCEIKNLNSMKFARRAIEFEFNRQAALLEKGELIQRQTLHFDADTGTTHPIRDKEEANDYRYFPDPDLPLVVLTDEYINDIAAHLALLPWQIEAQLKRDYGLSDYEVRILTEEPDIALFFIDFAKNTRFVKGAANLTINKILPYCQENAITISDFPISIDRLDLFIGLIEGGKLSNSAAYQQLFPKWILNSDQNPFELAKELNLIQESDASILEIIVHEVLEENKDKVIEYKKGKKGLIGLFMGQVMRKSGGKADPKVAGDILQRFLNS
jgi:aspartyl-tRNA(Asn)/glutamyl-tRNA(Gln) amidotransferase subunit B